MAYTEETTLDECLIENAVSAFRTLVTELVRKVNAAEPVIDYDDLSDEIVYKELAGEVDLSSLGEHVDYEALAEGINYDSLSDWMTIDYDDLAECVDTDELSSHFPQVDELAVLQERQADWLAKLEACGNIFAGKATAPVDADGNAV
jgi:hypothetical protein